MKGSLLIIQNGCPSVFAISKEDVSRIQGYLTSLVDAVGQHRSRCRNALNSHFGSRGAGGVVSAGDEPLVAVNYAGGGIVPVLGQIVGPRPVVGADVVVEALVIVATGNVAAARRDDSVGVHQGRVFDRHRVVCNRCVAGALGMVEIYHLHVLAVASIVASHDKEDGPLCK